MPDTAHYQAFLSYSHADRKLAQWLHRALETYRLPKKLIGQITPQGPVPARLARIFKDREELSASGSLGAAIDSALVASDALIVVCSRTAAKSRWVNEEIRNYKRLHGEARVFAVIADGEPFASNMLGREAEECFPPALRFVVAGDGLVTDQAAEPIAADLREDGDGKRRGKLKLIAGLTGVALDDLVRREAQRRAQRLTAVAVGASFLAVVMTVLSVIAFRARNDALKQRQQAEGLIEFMLVDLRKKLEPVGRLDVLDVVGEKALAHYETQHEQDLDANSLGHRSRALHLIGEIRQLRGNLGEALTAFQRAADTTATLLAKAPNDEQRIFDHAQSVFWVGTVARDRGQKQDAEKAFTQYRELAQRLVALNGSKPDWQIEVAYAAQNLGVMAIEDARPTDALKYLDETREIWGRHVAAQPELAFDLAHTYGWIAVAHEHLGDFEKAIAAQVAKQNQFRSVPNAGANKQVMRGLQNAEFELARLSLARGELALAEQHAAVAVIEAGKLANADATNLLLLTEFSAARIRLAEIELALGKRAAAQEHLQEARTDITRLIARDTTKTAWTITHQGQALALQARMGGTSSQDNSALMAEMRAYMANAKLVLDRTGKLRAEQVFYASAAEFELARLLRANGLAAEASKHWREVANRLAPYESESNYALLTLLARTRLALAERDGADAIFNRIEKSSYRHPNVAELVKEMNRGKGPASSTTQTRSTP